MGIQYASKSLNLLLQARIESMIFSVRGKRVMLDKDLSELYGVTTGNLNKAVKRNIDRFPDDFMFQLNKKEFESLIFQNGISKKTGRGGTRSLPYAFTEQGVAMLSSVLKSKKAVEVNIQIMRVFVRIRELLLTHKDLREQVEAVDKKVAKIFLIINWLMEEKKSKKRVGFKN